MNDQLILKFPSNKLYLKEDFYVSPSNQVAYDFVNSWPKWIKRIVNIFGPVGSGKTHISSILKSKTTYLEVQSDKRNYKKFFDIYKSVYANQIYNVSKYFNNEDGKNLFTIDFSLKCMNFLDRWID